LGVTTAARPLGSRLPLASLPGIAALLAVAIAVPYVVSTFWVRIATGLVLWIALGQAWNMVGGYTGLISFGHGAFFGVGAYVTGLLLNRGLGLPVAFAASLAASTALGAIIGLPTLRLRGAYFAIATWAFAEFVRQAVLVTEATGGSSGMQVEIILDEWIIYYIMLVAALGWLALSWWLLERRPFGLRLRAIRDHQEAAEMLGIPTTSLKMQAFSLSAAVTGAFGSLYGVWITFLHPDNVLASSLSDQMVVITLLGGIGVFTGPLLGAPLLYAIERFLWLSWSDNFGYLAVIGGLVALVVLFMPNGVAGLLAQLRSRPATKTALRRRPVS
jgi:branched-chain amino acid transport system permease protein